MNSSWSSIGFKVVGHRRVKGFPVPVSGSTTMGFAGFRLPVVTAVPFDNVSRFFVASFAAFAVGLFIAMGGSAAVSHWNLFGNTNFHVRMAELTQKSRSTLDISAQRTIQVRSILDRIPSSKLTDAYSMELAATIVRESVSAGLDPLFIASVIQSESTFNNRAISPMGARGLMQILPGTGRYVSGLSKISWKGETELDKIEYNIKLGIAYLKHLEGMFSGNWERVLIAYNWGPGNLQSALKNRTSVPYSCEKYARKILSNFAAWRGSMVIAATGDVALSASS